MIVIIIIIMIFIIIITIVITVFRESKSMKDSVHVGCRFAGIDMVFIGQKGLVGNGCTRNSISGFGVAVSRFFISRFFLSSSSAQQAFS